MMDANADKTGRVRTIRWWVVWDMLALQLSLALVYWARYKSAWLSPPAGENLTLIEHAVPALYLTIGWMLLFGLFGLYRHRTVTTPFREITRVFNAVTFGTLVIAVLTFDPVDPVSSTRGILLGYWAVMILFLGAPRWWVFRRYDPAPGPETGAWEGTYRRRLLILVSDLVLIILAYYLAFWLRFDGGIPADHFSLFYNTLPLVIIIRTAALLYFRLYGGLWRYASINDLLSIVKAVSVGTGFLVLPVFFAQAAGYPRSVFIIEWFLLIVFLGGSRFLIRGLREFTPRFFRTGQRVLVIGAGDAGEMIIRELKKNPDLNQWPVGLIDDDPAKRGTRLHGVPVLGTTDEISPVVSRYGIDQVLIAIPSATGAQMRRIVTNCRKIDVEFKTVPVLKELIGGRVSVHQLRDVRVEDLLRREAVVLDTPRIAEFMQNRAVMITGAAGSIGSELVRQMHRFSPSRVDLVDRSENGLHDLADELRRLYPHLPFRVFVADICDGTRFERLLSKTPPEIIFHAAAYKQVPLMEAHPDAAVLNNIGGSSFLLDWAGRVGVRAFVLISTDKAVHPRSVMGATKRAAEMIGGMYAHGSPMKVVAVRFGNVLGSEGSVVPLFRRQIAAGGPVTVTHPEVTRYFMTCTEAALLVVQAAALGRTGDIMVLDMGEPVRIIELARDLVTLSGLTPDVDIEIKITGLRAGEKLDEVLFENGAAGRPSAHPKIMIAPDDPPPPEDLTERVEKLLEIARTGDRVATRRGLVELVPTYRMADPPMYEPSKSGSES
jgi:FlaA1/EpsC-like NDP-sugar epimerase